MATRLLLVEPDETLAAQLQHAAEAVTEVDYYAEFNDAKRRLFGIPFDFVVTNVRLKAYNGLHLVYLASVTGGRTRCIAYTQERDPLVAREVRRAGAFYEISSCLAVTLSAYIKGSLPEGDRRDAAVADRRTLFRGGRRCWDQHLMGAADL